MRISFEPLGMKFDNPTMTLTSSLQVLSNMKLQTLKSFVTEIQTRQPAIWVFHTQSFRLQMSKTSSNQNLTKQSHRKRLAPARDKKSVVRN